MPKYTCTAYEVRGRIKLTKDEVDDLTSVIKKGSHTTQSYRAAQVLLNCDEGEHLYCVRSARHSLGKNTHQQISNILKINMRTTVYFVRSTSIERIKKKFVEGGLGSALLVLRTQRA
jgi:ribosomal protein S13